MLFLVTFNADIDELKNNKSFVLLVKLVERFLLLFLLFIVVIALPV